MTSSEIDARPARHRAKARKASRWSRRTKVLAAISGAALAGAGAFAATNWVVGLGSGSSGESQSATVSNLTIAAVASPAAGNLLYPGGTGDVVVTITNPNSFPVTVTGVQLPTNTSYATGYSNSALTSAVSGCTSSNSDVIWNFSSATSGTDHTLTSALTVAASGSLTVTLTNDASMTSSAPAACEASYFSMPSLTGVDATGGAATATTSPATDSWTS
jgi:hypothetical protein